MTFLWTKTQKSNDQTYTKVDSILFVLESPKGNFLERVNKITMNLPEKPLHFEKLVNSILNYITIQMRSYIHNARSAVHEVQLAIASFLDN